MPSVIKREISPCDHEAAREPERAWIQENIPVKQSNKPRKKKPKCTTAEWDEWERQEKEKEKEKEKETTCKEKNTNKSMKSEPGGSTQGVRSRGPQSSSQPQHSQKNKSMKSEPGGSTQGVCSRGPQSSSQPQQSRDAQPQQPRLSKEVILRSRADVHRSPQPHPPPDPLPGWQPQQVKQEPPDPLPGWQPQQVTQELGSDHSSDAEEHWQETRRRGPEVTPLPSPFSDQHGIYLHQEEPDESTELLEHANFNILVNLAVVSSEFRADDPNAISILLEFLETSPHHLLILLFENPDSLLVFNLEKRIWTSSSNKNNKKDYRFLGKGMYAITHKTFVLGSGLQSTVEQEGYGLSSMSFKLRDNYQEWVILVCRFPSMGAKIPKDLIQYMMAQMDSGTVLVVGLFGNTCSQLQNLFQDKGRGKPIYQGWKGVLVEEPEQVCTYPAYWMLLGNHKEKPANSQQALPLYQQMLDLPRSEFQKPFKENPFERSMLRVDKVPEWIWKDSIDKEAKTIGWVKTATPDFKWWTFGIYQLPLWLGGSRTGKPKTQKRRASEKAAQRRKLSKSFGNGSVLSRGRFHDLSRGRFHGATSN